MSNVTFKVGSLGPFDGMLKENILGHEYFLKFENAKAAPEDFGSFHEVTVYRPGQADLALQGEGEARLTSYDANRTTSGEIPLRRK